MTIPANSLQIGGSHYRRPPALSTHEIRRGEQHWDRIYRLYGRGYFVGCATKYVERYHLKGGKTDLLKAKHFIDKLIELEYPEVNK